MKLDLPYPAKILWPNGRGSHMVRARETKKHKTWAWTLALAVRRDAPAGASLRLVATFHPKPAGPLPDRDNASASLKAYQDGIALALGVDDRNFGQPLVHFGQRDRVGKVVVEVCAL